MYSKFSEKNKWSIEVINSNISDHGGFKEIVFKVTGMNVYSYLKFESGTHRVQRVPDTETQGRIHTSASTVAVLPIVEQVDDIEINPADLRIDTYRASGAGGQHVNKTDSAVRITTCQPVLFLNVKTIDLSIRIKLKLLNIYTRGFCLQNNKNKKKILMKLEKSKLVLETDPRELELITFPQGRVTDHRINLTLYKLEQLIEGNIDPLIDALIEESAKNNEDYKAIRDAAIFLELHTNQSSQEVGSKQKKSLCLC